MGYANSTFLDADDVYALVKKDIKDINGEIEDLSKLTKWLGVTTTPITENSTVNPIVISGVEVTAVSGDIAKYGDDEFKFTDVGTWQYYYDKTDVYTKDETDALLADKIPNVGNTTSDNMTIKRDAFKLANNATDESYVATDGNGNTFVVGKNRLWLDGKGANVDLREHILLRPAPNQKAYYGNDNNGLTDDMEIAVKGYVDAADNAVKGYVDATDNEIKALLIDNAAKNLLPITLDRVKKANEGAEGTWSNNVYTENGITFTVNTDDAGRGTGVTVAQTAGAASASLNLVPVEVELVDDEPVFIYDPTYSAGDYIISIGCELPTGVDLGILYNGNTQQYIHEDTTVTLTEGSGFTAWIYVRSNDVESGDPVIFDSFTVRPMLRRAAVTDGTFEVGYRTQKELDAAVRELQKSGGGEISSYSETVLWSNPDISGNPLPTNPIELSDNLSNYDTIYIMGGQYVNGRFYPIAIGTIPISRINSSTDFVWNYSDTFYGLSYTDDTHISLIHVAGGTDITFKEIIGINYGEHIADYESEVFPNA